MMMGPSSHMGRPPLQSRGFGMRRPRAEAMNIGEQKGGFLQNYFNVERHKLLERWLGFHVRIPHQGQYLKE